MNASFDEPNNRGDDLRAPDPTTWPSPDRSSHRTRKKSLFFGRLSPTDQPTTWQIILFIATMVSTTLMGGFTYSMTLMGILFCHEMGHYVAARHYRVRVSLPYFLPFPNLFGTFGAFIRMQSRIPNRKALFDIGILGPAMGVVIALPATVIGIALSEVQTVTSLTENTIRLGDSILFAAITQMIHGTLEEGTDLLLHPIGFAGWAGLFVTALNLLPMGQLDGGHIVYAIFQKRSIWIYRILFAGFAIFTAFWNRQWLLFLVLVFFLIRLNHPPTIDDRIPLGRKRTIYGILALIFFFLTFPPIPIQF